MNEKDIKLEDLVWFAITAPWFIGGLGGFLALGRQCVVLMKRGDWVPFSALDLLRIGFDSTWLYVPTDWIGIYKAFDWVHGGLFAAIVGGGASLILMLVIAPLMEKKK
jgi:hypothetical protein